jgi:hypothetical protein
MMRHDDYDDGCRAIDPEVWLSEAVEFLAPSEHRLADGVHRTAMILLSGLECGPHPPARIDTPSLELVDDDGIPVVRRLVRLRWINIRGVVLTVVVSGRDEFRYRLSVPDEPDDKGVHTSNLVNEFRLLVNEVYPTLNRRFIKEMVW